MCPGTLLCLSGRGGWGKCSRVMVGFSGCFKDSMHGAEPFLHGLFPQVRLVIAEKGLPCEERDVSMPLMEHKEPWFMRLNLGEEVPVIIHKDNIISDYNQIIDYMEKNFTGGKAGVDCVLGKTRL